MAEPKPWDDIPIDQAGQSLGPRRAWDDIPIDQPQGPPAPPQRTLGEAAMRQAGLGVRMGVEGIADTIGIAANPMIYAANMIPGVELPEYSSNVSALLTQAGLPVPENDYERLANFGGRLFSGGSAGNRLTNLVAQKVGLIRTPWAVTSPAMPAPTATSGANSITQRAVDVLSRHGINLDLSQRSGSRFLRGFQSSTKNHPATAQRAYDASEQQLREFTRAALRYIGINSDNATPELMLSAKNQIGNVFRNVARRNGALWDDQLQDAVISLMDDAPRVLQRSEIGILQRNIDLIMNNVDEAGKIDGATFNRLMTSLGKLSKREGIGNYARELEDILLESLRRAAPESADELLQASNQWRNLRVLEGTIDKGMQGIISPSRLANAWGTKANRAASVYGQGGDQGLIELARAGKEIIPDMLPDSGTIPRGMWQAPVRTFGTAIPYRAGQNVLQGRPGFVSRFATSNPGATAVVPALGVNALGR